MENESESYSEHPSTTESVEDNLRLDQEPCGENASVCSDAHTGGETVPSHPTSASEDSRESPGSEESGSPASSVGFPENGLHSHTLEAYLSDFGLSSSSGSDLGSMSGSCMERLIGRLESPSLDSAIKTELQAPEEKEDDEDDRCPSLFQVSMMTASTADSLPCTPTRLNRHADCITEEPEEGDRRAGLMRETAGEATVTPPKASGSGEGDGGSLKFGITGEASSTPDACSSYGGAVDNCEKDNSEADVFSRTTLDYTADDEDPDRCLSTFCVSADIADSDQVGTTATFSTGSREEFCNEERSTCGVSDKTLVEKAAQPGLDRKLQLNVCMSESLTGPNSQILSKEHLEVLQLLGLSETESSTVKADSPDSDIELLSLSQDDSLSALQQDQSDHMRQSHLEPSAHSVPSVSESCEEDTRLTPIMDDKTPGNNANYLQDGYIFNMEDPNLLKNIDSESDMSVDSPCHSPSPDAQVQMNQEPEAHEKKDTDRRVDAGSLDQSTKVDYFSPEDGATETTNFDPEFSMNSITEFSILGLPSKISAGDNQVRAAREVLSNQARGQEHSEDNESVRGSVTIGSNTDVRDLSPRSQDCSSSDRDPSCTQTSQRGNNIAYRPTAAPRKGISAGSFPVNESFSEEPMAPSGVSSLPGVPENQRARFRAAADDSQKNDDDFGRPSSQEQNYERYTSGPNPSQGHTNTEPFPTRPTSSPQNTFEQGKFGSHSEDHHRQFAGAPCYSAEQFPGRDLQTGPAFSGINTDQKRFTPQNTFEQGKFGSHSEDHHRQFTGAPCTPAEQFPSRGQTGPAFSGINTDQERFTPQNTFEQGKFGSHSEDHHRQFTEAPCTPAEQFPSRGQTGPAFSGINTDQERFTPQNTFEQGKFGSHSEDHHRQFTGAPCTPAEQFPSRGQTGPAFSGINTDQERFTPQNTFEQGKFGSHSEDHHRQFTGAPCTPAEQFPSRGQTGPAFSGINTDQERFTPQNTFEQGKFGSHSEDHHRQFTEAPCTPAEQFPSRGQTGPAFSGINTDQERFTPQNTFEQGKFGSHSEDHHRQFTGAPCTPAEQFPSRGQTGPAFSGINTDQERFTPQNTFEQGKFGSHSEDHHRQFTGAPCTPAEQFPSRGQTGPVFSGINTDQERFTPQNTFEQGKFGSHSEDHHRQFTGAPCTPAEQFPSRGQTGPVFSGINTDQERFTPQNTFEQGKFGSHSEDHHRQFTGAPCTPAEQFPSRGQTGPVFSGINTDQERFSPQPQNVQVCAADQAGVTVMKHKSQGRAAVTPPGGWAAEPSQAPGAQGLQLSGTGPVFSGINTDQERFAPQPQNVQVCAADQAGVTVMKHKSQGRAAGTPTGGWAAEPSQAPGAQGLQLSGTPDQTSPTAQGGSPLSAQDRHLSSPQQQVHQELSATSERKDLKLAPQSLQSQRHDQALEDLQKSVMVTGSALKEEDEEMCSLYFENEKRSGGGEIEKDCLLWDQKRKCFFITFIDSQVAKRVAAREHALKSHPVQVEVYSPPPTPRDEAALTPEGRPLQTQARVKNTPLPSQPGRHSATSTNAASEYRVKVSGVPSGTSADCLQNYLECVSDISVTSIALSKDRNSAVVTMSYSGDELDLSSMNSACVESPLEEGSLMSFEKVSSSPSSAIQVTGLKPTTADEAVQFFFSNKRRNKGGPVKRVERSQDKASALVHFINHEDAEAVVKKGDHTLDGNPLHVTLHDEADFENESDESERRRSVSSEDGESFRRDEPSSDDKYAADQEGKAAQFSKGGWGSREGEYARGNTGLFDRHHESAMSRDTNKDQYSSSASAQMKHREEYNKGMGDPRRHTDGYPQQEGSRYQEDPSKAFNRQTDDYRGQADSGLIDSFRSPKKDKNEFKETERMERGPSNQYSSGSSNTMFDSGNHRPTAASSTKTSPETSSTRQKPHTVINLGGRTMRRITDNHVLLRELTTKVKSVGGRFRWNQPDQMIVTCLLDEPFREWEEEVQKKVNHFLAHLPQHERLAAEKEKPTPLNADKCGRRDNRDSDDDTSETPTSLNADSSKWGYRDNRESDDDTPATPMSHSIDSKPTVNAEIPISSMQDDEIPNLKPCQFKILCIPAALEKFYRGYPGLKVSVDKERKIAKVSAPEDNMKKAFSDVLAFVMSLRETKMSLTPGLLKMFEREDTKEWIQKTVISEHGFVCHWEVSEKQIIISGQVSDLDRIHQMFKEAFNEKSIKLEKEEACTLKSPAWRSFLEQLEDSGSHPQPVLLPQGDNVIIVDTPSNMSSSELKLKKFLKENKLQGKTLEISPIKAKLLVELCDQEVKELTKKAKDIGVNISFNKNGVQAKGPKDCLPGVEGEVREMVARIKEDKMTFKKPGMVGYLKGPKGQDFLAQTGPVTKCYITTDSGGAGASQSGGRVLAKAQLSPDLDLQIIQGDITQCAVDAIVNAANGRLKHDGGVAAAIVKAGGRCIQEESDELVAEHGELNDGEVLVTGAGTLPCSHVIHAVGPIWSGGYKGEEEALIQTVKSILKEAEKMKVTSVAIPAISCGIFRFPVERATSTIMKTIARFVEKGRDLSLQTVVLIDMGADPLRGFISAGKFLFGKRWEDKDTPTSAPPRGKHSGGSSHKPTERTERGHPGTHDSHRSRTDHGHDETSQGPIKIIPGEIAKSKTDVIVCTTHPSLDLQKGVLSKSISREGGDAIQQDLKKYHEQFGPAKLGHVVRTSGGDLRCKFVFHLSLPSWRDDHGKAMKSAVKECLDEASKKKQKSIAFPSLGTGRLGYPSDKVASIMQSAISQWFSENHRTTLKEAQIIVFPKDTETLQAFKDNDRHGGGHSGGRGHGHRGGRGGDADYSGGPSNCKVKVGKITVMVKEGDILAESCDAIVNSSNDSLDLTKGVVSKAIMKACGQEIVLECSKQKDEMAENGVVVTRVDGLASCRHVIHVSADRFKAEWTEGILAVLRLAEEEGIRSVAMPALGTGGRGANPEKLAQDMHKAVKEFSRESKSVKEVNVVVFQKQMMRPYISAFDPDASSSSSRGAERSDSGDGASADRGEKRQTHGADVFIYSLQQSAIKEAREKIHRHMTSIFITRTETNPVIANFNPKQKDQMFKLQKKHNVEISLDDKKGAVTFTGIDIDVTQAASDLKDIILSATTQRHLAAGGPPVRWQYQTGKDKFADFDPETNLTIEAAFKKKESSVHFSDKRSRRYKIVFKDRKEYSVDDRSAQPVTVKRRDIMEEKKRDIPLPDHWEPMKGDKVKLVKLKPESSEYKRVAGHFGKQGQASVKKIERVQNPSLFQQYKIKKRELEQNNPKKTENEKRLFHGTSSDSIQGIVTNGFNRSYCGKNGTALGNGVYFAADSATSMGYAAQGGQMFQARVLVGEYTPGNSGMRTAPIKPNSNRPYDSVSNGQPPNATVFVIFHDCQAYPEYLISF